MPASGFLQDLSDAAATVPDKQLHSFSIPLAVEKLLPATCTSFRLSKLVGLCMLYEITRAQGHTGAIISAEACTPAAMI